MLLVWEICQKMSGWVVSVFLHPRRVGNVNLEQTSMDRVKILTAFAWFARTLKKCIFELSYLSAQFAWQFVLNLVRENASDLLGLAKHIGTWVILYVWAVDIGLNWSSWGGGTCSFEESQLTLRLLLPGYYQNSRLFAVRAAWTQWEVWEILGRSQKKRVAQQRSTDWI